MAEDLPPPRRRLSRKGLGRLFAVALLSIGGFLVLGNLAIAGLWKLESQAAAADAGIEVPGIAKFRVVDDRLWRGAAPHEMATYAALARAGATTVVDLRAEENVHVDAAQLARLGLRLVRIPVRDGQVPSSVEVEQFLAAVADSRGPTFVHCGAGVGRTGTMAAAYLVATGGASPFGALRENLAVGPPSLEQIVFAADLGDGPSRPTGAVVLASRVLDAPRRLWSRLG